MALLFLMKSKAPSLGKHRGEAHRKTCTSTLRAHSVKCYFQVNSSLEGKLKALEVTTYRLELRTFLRLRTSLQIKLRRTPEGVEKNQASDERLAGVFNVSSLVLRFEQIWNSKIKISGHVQLPQRSSRILLFHTQFTFIGKFEADFKMHCFHFYCSESCKTGVAEKCCLTLSLNSLSGLLASRQHVASTGPLCAASRRLH